MQKENVGKRVDTLLRRYFPMRTEVINALIFSLLSGEPALLVSPPGTAKTLMITSLANAIDGKHFVKQLSQYTEPDEILGPLDIQAYRNGEYKRILQTPSGEVYLPLADIVYLDEVFKASTAIRNYLLQALQERIVTIGATTLPVRALTFYFSSNEISYDREDMAFFDRMVIRVFFDYLPPALTSKLITVAIDAEANGVPYSIKPVASVDDVLAARREVNKLFYGVAQQPKILSLMNALIESVAQRGIVVSDRRKVKLLRVAAAIAYFYDEDRVAPEDLADAARLVLPQNKEALGVVNEVIGSMGLELTDESIRRLDMVVTELTNLVENVKKRGESVSISDLKMLMAALAKAKKELENAGSNRRYAGRIKKYSEKIEEATNVIEEIMSEVTTVE